MASIYVFGFSEIVKWISVSFLWMRHNVSVSCNRFQSNSFHQNYIKIINAQHKWIRLGTNFKTTLIDKCPSYLLLSYIRYTWLANDIYLNRRFSNRWCVHCTTVLIEKFNPITEYRHFHALYDDHIRTFNKKKQNKKVELNVDKFIVCLETLVFQIHSIFSVFKKTTKCINLDYFRNSELVAQCTPAPPLKCYIDCNA